MEQSIEERGGDDRIAEHLAPFGKAAVGGEDHGAAFIAGVDQLEEQVAAAWDDRQVADLVDDQQGRSAEEADALRQTTLALGAGELAEQLGEGAEVDAAPGLHRSEEHTSELQSLMRISNAVFCLKKKK